jgi:hypothetical protein
MLRAAVIHAARGSRLGAGPAATQLPLGFAIRRFSAPAAAGAEDTTTPNVDLQEEVTNELDSLLKPSEVVRKLDSYIVGQADAKRAVAIALRNRWRRHRLPDDLKMEVMPKNILMVGPTGEFIYC